MPDLIDQYEALVLFVESLIADAPDVTTRNQLLRAKESFQVSLISARYRKELELLKDIDSDVASRGLLTIV